jgi:hypothetical protein
VGSRLLVVFPVALDPSGPGPVVVRGSSVSYTAAAVDRAPGSFTSIEDTSVSSSAGTSARRERADAAGLFRWCERSGVSAVAKNGTSPVRSSRSRHPSE